jgi:molecular chaperone DnaK
MHAPSHMRRMQDGSVLVGQVAVEAANADAASTFFSVKRFIGRPFSQVQDMLPGVTYTVAEGPGGSSVLLTGNQQAVTPEEVSSHIVRHLVERARAAVAASGQEVREAVITLPAYFDVAQRKATVEAAKMAGLHKVTLLQGGLMKREKSGR